MMLNYSQYIKESKILSHPFIQAASKGSNNKVKEYIKFGVDIDMRDGEGRTALMNASYNKFLMVVDTLLQAGADPNLQDKNSRTALMMSSTVKIIDKLLDAGADVNISNNVGRTAIMEYLNNINFTNIIILLEKFLQKGLNLDIKDYFDKNFYELLKEKQEKAKYIKSELDLSNKIQEYIDEKFPQYKEEWELKQNMEKYNL